MRFVKERLEVITCYIPSGNEIVSEENFEKVPPSQDNKAHFPPNTCFNVFWFNQQLNWTAPNCKYLIEYLDGVKSLASAKEGSKAVVRLCSVEKQTGRLVYAASGFYVLPNVVITNCHVNNKKLQSATGSNLCFAYMEH